MEKRGKGGVICDKIRPQYVRREDTKDTIVLLP